jgi:putative DNA primase/helicase
MNIRDLGLRAGEDAEKLCQVLLPGGKRLGKQWVVGDVTGAPGDSMAVELEGPKRGQWFDHAAGIGGDMLKLVELNRNLKGVVAAADETRKLLGIEPWRPGANGVPKVPTYDPCAKAWMNKKTGEWLHSTRAWAYRDATGVVDAYVCRFDWVRDGKQHKDVVPQRKGDDGLWHWRGYKGDEKRPLYGLELIAKTNDGRPLLIVEGEKTCDAARKLFPKACVVTWMGGASAAAKTDWTPVTDWKGPMVVWPDNDDEGFGAAVYLRGRFPKLRQVELPKGLPPKWDLADEVPEGVSVQGIFDAALAPPAKLQLATPETNGHTPKPYICLGYDEAGYYFINRGEGVLLHYTTSMFTELGVHRIANDEYWEGIGVLKDKSNKVDFIKAAKSLMDECGVIGTFDQTRIRGRGVWEDEGRIVIHLGDRLIVDGKETDFIDHKSRFTYLTRPTLRGVDFKNPLTAVQSSELISLLEKCTWQNPRSAYLLAGWVYCAFVCGIIPWRPHFFLKGESSSGKTWQIGYIVQPLLGDFARAFMAVASTEAGVRQAMLSDALALLLDEFDADQAHSSDAMAGITGLARQSSSQTGGAGVKGSQQGEARFYALKSCFLFCGTAPAFNAKADESRITVAELCKANATDNSFNFAEIQAMAAKTTGNQSWVESFRGRVLSKVREMMESVRIFRALGARVLQDTRAGDQTGTLLAGAWMTFNDQPPTEKQAEAFMDSMQWGDVVPTEADTDHSKCLKAFLAHRIDFEDQGHRMMETVGRLIERALDTNIPVESSTSARRGLEQHGVKIDGPGIFVAKHHRGVAAIFRGTVFIDKWDTHFLRIAGAQLGELRFNGPRYKGVYLPQDSLRVG